MNTSTLKMALNAGNSAWNQFKKYRDEKAVEAYDRLSEAAESVGGVDGLRERGSELLDDSRREAGNVTRAARVRLEKALDDAADKGQELAERGQDYREQARKSKKKNQRKARMSAARGTQQAAKKALRDRKKANVRVAKIRDRRNRKDESGGNKWLIFGLLAALIAAVGGGAYWYFNRKQTPGTTPPRVDEQEEGTQTRSTLVYSTETPEDVDPSEGTVQSEEELLASLDDQLEQHRAEQEAAEEDPVSSESQTPVADAAAAAVTNSDEVSEDLTDEDTENDRDAASDELLEEGEQIQAEYDRNNSPQRDQSDKD